MKELYKGILDNDMVISAENVQKMGEVIALTCIKTVIVRSGKDLHYLYKGIRVGLPTSVTFRLRNLAEGLPFTGNGNVLSSAFVLVWEVAL